MAGRSYSPLDLETDRFDSPLYTEASEPDFDKMMQDFKTAFYPGSLLASYMASPDLSPPLTPTSSAAWARRRMGGYDLEPELDAFAKGSDVLYSHLAAGQDPSRLQEVAQAEEEEEDPLPSVFRLDGPKSRKSKKKKKEREKEKDTAKEKEKSKAQTKPVFPVARGLVPKNARRRVNFGHGCTLEAQMSSSVRGAAAAAPAPADDQASPARPGDSRLAQAEKSGAAARSVSGVLLLAKKEDEDLLQCFLPTSERPKTPASQPSRTSIGQARSPSLLSGRKSSSSTEANDSLGTPDRGCYSPCSSSTLGSTAASGDVGRSESSVRLRQGSGDQRGGGKDPENGPINPPAPGRRAAECQGERRLDPKLIDFRRRPVEMKTTGFGRTPFRMRGADSMEDDGALYAHNCFSALSRQVPRIPVTSPSRLNQMIGEGCEAVRHAARARSSSRRQGWQQSSNNSSLTASDEPYPSPSFHQREEPINEDVDGLIQEIFSSVPRPPSGTLWDRPEACKKS